MTETSPKNLRGPGPLKPFIDAAAPEGFTPVELFDPFEAFVGPFFERIEEDGTRVAAFRIDERHVREDGTVHEGMMLTFADAFLGGAAWRAKGDRPCVTLSLQASVLADAKLGDVVTCRAKADHQTRAIVFVSASFWVGDDKVMTATSLFKVLGER
ncbi:PaaI family thioesterase [Parvibaculum sp.]|uniref:PaaI family thioesterase n=1 Tax=Parvibaculum sp. TaxID=2024848 RepID=UPI00320F3D5C